MISSVAGAQVAVFVDVADDELGDLLGPRRGVGHGELPGQVIGEVGRTRERVLDGELFVLLPHPARVVAVLDVVLEVGVVVDLVEGVLLLLVLGLGVLAASSVSFLASAFPRPALLRPSLPRRISSRSGFSSSSWLRTSWSSSFDSCSSLIACCSEGVMISFWLSLR